MSTTSLRPREKMAAPTAMLHSSVLTYSHNHISRRPYTRTIPRQFGLVSLSITPCFRCSTHLGESTRQECSSMCADAARWCEHRAPLSATQSAPLLPSLQIHAGPHGSLTHGYRLHHPRCLPQVLRCCGPHHDGARGLHGQHPRSRGPEHGCLVLEDW